MKTWIVLGSLVAVLVMFGVFAVGLLNSEARLAIAVESKQTDQTSEFDNLTKKISQMAQIPEAKKDALKEIFVEYASARSGDKTSGSLANWIHEAVPNVDMKEFENLQNIIVASRDAWTMRQKELIDLDREHDAMFVEFPTGQILRMFGRKRTEIVVITSSKTEKAFETGKDDDVQLFN
ncbi:MAG: hypothetical protein WC119_00140 [Synergistaceae bacterium]